MRAFDEDPDLRWLFCLTHPDDELAIAGWIHHLASRGQEVYMSWTHDTVVRRKEAIGAATVLKVPASCLHFHGASDGHVVDEIEELIPKFNAMMAEVQPDRIVVGAFECGHIDHDTTNLLVHLTKPEAATTFEAPFYHTYLTRMPIVNRFAGQGPEEIFTLESADRLAKKALLRAYPSQAIYRNMLFANLRSIAIGLGSLLSSERLRLQTHFDYLVPNLPPFLSKNVVHCETWRRWTDTIRPFVE